MRPDHCSVFGREGETQPQQQQQEPGTRVEACTHKDELVLCGARRIRELKELLVCPLEEELEILHRRGVAVLEAHEKTFLDDTELLCA